MMLESLLLNFIMKKQTSIYCNLLFFKKLNKIGLYFIRKLMRMVLRCCSQLNYRICDKSEKEYVSHNPWEDELGIFLSSRNIRAKIKKKRLPQQYGYRGYIYFTAKRGSLK